MKGTSSIDLSVVVTIVDGGESLRSLLDALSAQQNAPSMEVLVAWDDSVADVASLASRYPVARFLRVGAIATERPMHSAAGRHEALERRRAAALASAGGALIAIIEDRAVPRPDWAATMVRLHSTLPHGVIGGAILPGVRDELNWAMWAVDYGRYATPFEAGPRDWVSDVNVCYKRRCLDATRDVWSSRYNEARLHWTLAASGEVLYLSPEPVVELRTRYGSLGALLPERFAWGRLFGHVRATEASMAGRLKLLAAAPAIPFLLYLRHAAVQRRIGNGERWSRAKRQALALLVVWSAGEFWGALTRRP